MGMGALRLEIAYLYSGGVIRLQPANEYLEGAGGVILSERDPVAHIQGHVALHLPHSHIQIDRVNVIGKAA